MKVYFEDGMLRYYNAPKCDMIIDAFYGVSYCREQLDMAKEQNCDAVYTNSIIAMNCDYCWNEELGAPEAYIRESETGELTRIDQLTCRHLRRAHNIAKLYLNGAFDNTLKEIAEWENEIMQGLTENIEV